MHLLAAEDWANYVYHFRVPAVDEDSAKKFKFLAVQTWESSEKNGRRQSTMAYLWVRADR